MKGVYTIRVNVQQPNTVREKKGKCTMKLSRIVFPFVIAGTMFVGMFGATRAADQPPPYPPQFNPWPNTYNPGDVSHYYPPPTEQQAFDNMQWEHFDQKFPAPEWKYAGSRWDAAGRFYILAVKTASDTGRLPILPAVLMPNPVPQAPDYQRCKWEYCGG
jgi:hypothetical protein